MTTLSTGASVNLPAGKVAKELQGESSPDIVGGLASMQGRRPDFEDAHALQCPIPNFPSYSFMAVFDGHGGTLAAQYASQHLLPAIVNRPEFQTGYMTGDISSLRKAMVSGFLDMDRALRQYMIDEAAAGRGSTSKRSSLHGGCTACTALICPGYVIVANAGDSRSVLVRRGRAVPMSRDHKPTDDGELRRIEASGSTVSARGRVGSLNVSRGLGDHDLKDPSLPQPEQAVSPEPELSVVDRSPDEDEFLILACDGVWDVMSNHEVAQFVRSGWEGLKRGNVSLDNSQATGTSMAQGTVAWDPAAAAVHVAELLADEALARGSRDNITTMVAAFRGMH